MPGVSKATTSVMPAMRKIGLCVIRKACLETKSRDPIAIFRQVIRSPHIHMHGPEHHVLVGRRSAAGSVSQRRRPAGPGAGAGGDGAPGRAICLAAIAACGAPAGLVSARVFPQHCHKSDAAFGPELGLEQPVDRQEPCSHRCNRRPPVLQKRFVYRTVAGGGVHSSTRIGANERPQQIQCVDFGRNNQCLGAKCPVFPQKRRGTVGLFEKSLCLLHEMLAIAALWDRIMLLKY